MGSVLGAFENIAQSIDDFVDTPNAFSTIWNAPDVAHALQAVKAVNWNKNPGYSFKIDGGGVSGIVKYYNLQLNPEDIDQSEPFSIKIIPTQSGIVTENEGFVTKDLVISGTTGVYPKRPGTGYLTLGKSGYKEFMDFRNFIREYAEIKTLEEGKIVKLIFRNYKDNEFWYVEPLNFAMKRNKSKPFSYDYKVTFKIIGKPVPPSIFPVALTDFVAQVDQIYDAIDTAIATFENTITFLENVEGAFETIILTPLQKVAYAISAIRNGVNTVSSLPREFYQNLLFEVRRIRDNACDLLGLGDETYNTTLDRISTLEGSAATDVTLEGREVLSGFVDAENALTQFLCTDNFFDEQTAEVTVNNQIIGPSSFLSTDEILNKQISSKRNILKMFNNEISLPTPNSSVKVEVQTGDTLERIALRHLNDASRWIEIMSLNNLKPPYVDETLDQEGVLNPGDEVLIPSNTSININNINIVNTRITSLTRGLTKQERALGIDLWVNSNFDLIPNNRQDLELVFGFKNIDQTIMLKMGYEKGSLLYHPRVGIGLVIGEKNLLMVDELYQSMRETILSDPRFFGVDQLRLLREGGTIKLSLKTTLAATRTKVPLVLTF